jgi:hypothetical protein
MAYYTHTKDPIGVFVERDTGNYFEFSINEDHMAADEMGGFTHKVWVGDTIGSPYRYAVVMKTVAYIAVDEDEDGPVVEKWYLKSNKEYAL